MRDSDQFPANTAVLAGLIRSSRPHIYTFKAKHLLSKVYIIQVSLRAAASRALPRQTATSYQFTTRLAPSQRGLRVLQLPIWVFGRCFCVTSTPEATPGKARYMVDGSIPKIFAETTVLKPLSVFDSVSWRVKLLGPFLVSVIRTLNAAPQIQCKFSRECPTAPPTSNFQDWLRSSICDSGAIQKHPYSEPLRRVNRVLLLDLFLQVNMLPYRTRGVLKPPVSFSLQELDREAQPSVRGAEARASAAQQGLHVHGLRIQRQVTAAERQGEAARLTKNNAWVPLHSQVCKW